MQGTPSQPSTVFGYDRRVAIPLSLLIAVIAAYRIVRRLAPVF